MGLGTYICDSFSITIVSTGKTTKISQYFSVLIFAPNPPLEILFSLITIRCNIHDSYRFLRTKCESRAGENQWKFRTLKFVFLQEFSSYGNEKITYSIMGNHKPIWSRKLKPSSQRLFSPRLWHLILRVMNLLWPVSKDSQVHNLSSTLVNESAPTLSRVADWFMNDNAGKVLILICKSR